MEISVAYNNDRLNLTIPDGVEVDQFNSKKIEHTVSYDDFIDQFKKYEASFTDDRILFVINDAHRSTPTALILQWINDYDSTILTKVDFLIACGTHKEPDDTELKRIFGDLFLFAKARVKFHNCHDADSLISIGKTDTGDEIFLNSALFDYDQIFIINSVEPHYFAGFTGGRKSLIPGLADFKTIERNHNLANSLDCAPTKLSDNPMAEDLDRSLNLAVNKIEALQKALTLQIVYDSQNNITDLFWGNIADAFAKAVTSAREIYCCQTDNQYDIVLMEINAPIDRSVYQAQKALENNQTAVTGNGYAVVVSACVDGIGSEHFFDLAKNWDKENNCSKDGHQHFGSHKLSRVNAMSRRIHTGLYSEANPDEVSQVFYEPIEDIQQLIDKLYSENKLNRIAVVYDAAHVVLELNNNK